MNPKSFSHMTAWEVALALSFFDSKDERDPYGEKTARDMLEGVEEFTDEELDKLAAFKGVTVEYLIENDPSFAIYADPVTEVRKDIAVKLLKFGADVEFAAEICELPVGKLRKLI